MGKGKSKNRSENFSLERKTKELELKSGKPDRLIVFSLHKLDPAQGQDSETWENEKLLSSAIEKLRAICGHTVPQAVSSQLIKIYDSFPPHSKFSHPRHVPSDAKWSSMHIMGKPCIIGYLEDNVFHVVFFDKDHEFWPSKKKHT